MVQPTLFGVTVDYHGVKPFEYSVSVPTKPYQDGDGFLVDRYSFRFTDYDKNGGIDITEMPQKVLACNENHCSAGEVPSNNEDVLAAVVNASQDLKRLIGGLNLKQQMQKVATRLAGENSAENARYVVTVGTDCSDSVLKSFEARGLCALEFYNFNVGDIAISTQQFMHLESIRFNVGKTQITVLNSGQDAAAIHQGCELVRNFSHAVSLPETELNGFLNEAGRSLQIYWK